MGQVGFKNGVMPEMTGIPRLATGCAMNIHGESPFWCWVEMDLLIHHEA
jgi:hypothetical protein